jgi:PKD repeat protein
MFVAAGLVAAQGAHAAASPPRVASSWVPSMPRTGAAVRFTASATDPDLGPITGWAWDFNGDGVVDSTLQNPTYAGFSTPGDHRVRLVVTDHDGEHTIDDHVLHVHDGNLSPVAGQIFPLPSRPRTGVPVQFSCACVDPDANPALASPVAYDWDFGDGSAHATSRLPTHAYTAGGNYIVKVTVTDGDGVTATSTVAVQVHAGNEAPVVTGAATTMGAQGQPVSLSVDVTDDAPGALTYDWSFDDGGLDSSAAAPVHVYGAAGDRLVRVKVTDADHAVTTFTEVVHVSRPPGTPVAAYTTPFDLPTGFDLTSTAAAPQTGQAVWFQDASVDPDGGSIVTHHWDFGDGASSSEASPVHAFSAPGDHVVALTVTDDDGKTSEYAQVMHVHTENTPAVVQAGASVDAPRTSRTIDLTSTVSDADSPGAAGATYDWNFGDATPHSTQADTTHVWTVPGDYDVILSVTDAGGALTRSAFTVHVHDENAAPEAHFSSDPSYPGTDVTVSFFDNSVDRDGQITSYTWDLGDGTTATGNQPTHAYAAPGDYSVTETVTDDDGVSTVDVETIHVGPVPPTNTTPPSITGIPQDRRTLTANAGQWTGTNPMTFTYVWIRCDPTGSLCAPITGASTTTSDQTATYVLGEGDIDQIVKVQVIASNLAGPRAAMSAPTGFIAEVPPASTAPPAVTGDTRDGQVVSASTGGWDHTGPLGYTYRWQRCDGSGGGCSDIPGATGANYRLVVADEAQTVLVRVTATDRHGSTTADSAVSPVIGPGPPVKLTDPGISGLARDGVTLSATDGAFGGSPATKVTRQWQRCDSAGANCSDLATGVNYALTPGDVGQRIRVVVTEDNALGSDTGTSPTTSVVLPAPPANTRAPGVTGTATDGQTLTADNGGFTGTPTLSYAYRWQRCDGAGAACVDISANAGAPTYSLTSADVGRRLRVRVTATNVAGSASALSAPTGVVAAVPPMSTAPPGAAGSPREGALLLSTPGTFSGSTPQLSYRWRRCDAVGAACTDVQGGTADSYRPAAADVGHRLVVVVTATNAAGSASGTSAPTALVQAGPPVAVSPPAITGTAQAGSHLAILAGSFAGTAPMSHAVRWRRCDPHGGACADVAGATSLAYVPGATDIGHTLRVVVAARNGLGSATASSAPTKTVAADPVAIRAALRTALAPPRRSARVDLLLRRHSYVASFDNRFGAGQVELDWYAKVGHRSVLVARAIRRFAGLQRGNVVMRLTTTGRRVLGASHHGARLAGRGSFTPSVGARVTLTRTVLLRAR